MKSTRLSLSRDQTAGSVASCRLFKLDAVSIPIRESVGFGLAYVVVFERFAWFDRQVRSGGCPNAPSLAARFEVSRQTAQRNIDFMRDRLGAPREYDLHRRGYRWCSPHAWG